MLDTLHSWLRYPVFFVAVAAFGYALWGVVAKQPYRKVMWDLAGLFALGLYVQIFSGFLLIFSNRFFSGSLGIHMVLSMAAAALAQITYSANRRRAREERSYIIHVWGIGLASALVVVGILAIRSSLFG
jgi:hypothetical protein